MRSGCPATHVTHDVKTAGRVCPMVLALPASGLYKPHPE
ncbi:UNVERIFIED_CONTAM: hypothetical protein JM85_1097 [Acetobacter peroxydans]